MQCAILCGPNRTALREEILSTHRDTHFNKCLTPCTVHRAPEVLERTVRICAHMCAYVNQRQSVPEVCAIFAEAIPPFSFLTLHVGQFST